MLVYLLAGVFLLVAVVFVIKYFIDNNKASKVEPENKKKADVVIITDGEKEDASEIKRKKVKKDLILALVFMALCEICILLEKFVFKI